MVAQLSYCLIARIMRATRSSSDCAPDRSTLADIAASKTARMMAALRSGFPPLLRASACLVSIHSHALTGSVTLDERVSASGGCGAVVFAGGVGASGKGGASSSLDGLNVRLSSGWGLFFAIAL